MLHYEHNINGVCCVMSLIKFGLAVASIWSAVASTPC